MPRHTLPKKGTSPRRCNRLQARDQGCLHVGGQTGYTLDYARATVAPVNSELARLGSSWPRVGGDPKHDLCSTFHQPRRRQQLDHGPQLTDPDGNNPCERVSGCGHLRRDRCGLEVGDASQFSASKTTRTGKKVLETCASSLFPRGDILLVRSPLRRPEHKRRGRTVARGCGGRRTQ